MAGGVWNLLGALRLEQRLFDDIEGSFMGKSFEISTSYIGDIWESLRRYKVKEIYRGNL